MGAIETWLLDAAGLQAALEGMAQRLAAIHRPGAPVRVVGVRTRGFPLARRLADQLGRLLDAEVPVGAVEITLYRDDLDQRASWPVLKGTDIPFPVEDTEIVLVDDVLNTGRTARAALNAVCDLGRPARVILAAVVDRGGRELPLAADVVGIAVKVEAADNIQVRTAPIDAVEGVVRVAESDRS